ncbi:kinesin-like protein KIF16B [Patella vulgata]|uniref:kinesin-like protein KIF16B n=1 Tax=Patella vulgata TaxID=6465 RepID=UPI00218052BF|nr:kinesin-like protein KIF16B [Patella vulgata]
MTSVKVAVRVRPINQRELDLESKIIVSMSDEKTTIKNIRNPFIKTTVLGIDGDLAREQQRKKEFTFDKSFWSAIPTDKHFATQEEVFSALGKDVVSAAYEGYNVCVFAYGQTGSGKSYTMMGSEENPGFIPRFCKELFSRMTDDNTSYKTEVSYLEIYNEKVRDLLKIPSHSNQIVHSLRVREHPKEGPYVQDLSKHTVMRHEDIQHMIEKGNNNRTTASTLMNDVSSRSHAIYTILFTQAGYINDMPSEKHSKVHLVDLAGSERADATGAIGIRLKESGNINKSLVTLGNVISTLAENCESDGKKRQIFIPYRDSVLTWLLKDSLGGNAKTIMIATISPADVNYAETLSTLRYANRAKNIINRPTVNEDPNVRLIRELREEIARLKALLGSDQDIISSPKVQEKLHENEARIKVLTEEWAGKWKETANILQEQSNLGLRKEGVGIVLDSTLPHLVGINDDRLSTGVMLYHLKEGITTLGISDEQETPDITLGGPDILTDHCMIEYDSGVVTLHPSQQALCQVNGTNITEPTRLQQGAVILLGHTNMFRFNNPAEAAKLRELSKSNSNLNTSLLSHSRTSLLTRSLTDLYKSADNLYRSVDNVSFMTLGDIETSHKEDIKKLEVKRQDILQLEQAYQEAEEERKSRMAAMEEEILSKQKCLAILTDEIDNLRLQIKESPLGEYGPKTLQDTLIFLENQEQTKLDMKNRMKEKLKQEIEDLEKEYDEEKINCENGLKEFDEKEMEKQLEINELEENLNSSLEAHTMFKNQELDRIRTEKKNLDSLKRTLEKETEQFLSENPGYKEKLGQMDKKEQEMKEIHSQKDRENNMKWKEWLEEINVDNQQLEEAWKDLEEHEQRVYKKLTSPDTSESEKKLLKLERKELEEARDLLKVEEDKIALREKDMLDQMEKQMDSWERQKRSDLDSIYQERDNLKQTRSPDILTLESEIKVKTKMLQKSESKLLESNQEMLKAEKQSAERVNNVQDELSTIRSNKERVTRTLSRKEEDMSRSVSAINSKLERIEEETELELSKLREEKQRLLKIKAETMGNNNIDDNKSTGTGSLHVELKEEQIKLQQQLENLESTRELLEQAKRDIDNKQRQFDEERDMELDKIEFEKLKLQDLEKQDRINGMVEQEVKRRVFEEKLERDKQRRLEREKDKSERDQEMQRLKLTHAREIRRLKAKLAAKNNKVTSQSNPYGNQVMTNVNQSTNDLSRRRHSSSSGSFTGPAPKIKITIPNYVLRKGSNSHHEYEVKIVIGDENWTVFRRYSRFRELHFSLLKKFPEMSLLVFPPRKLFHKSEKVVIERRKQLEEYMQHLMELCLRMEDCPLHPSKNKYLSRHILCEFDSFFKKGLYEVSKYSTT